MARPTTLSDAQMLEAARAVFLERGFSATAQDVAERAGCSSGSLFKRFPTKEALFLAAMQTPPSADFEVELETRVGQGELHDTLAWLAARFLEFVRESLPREMMAWSARLEESSRGVFSSAQLEDASACRPPADHPLVGRWQAVKGFLEREKGLGRLRPSVSPEVVTGAFIGALVHCAMLELMGGRGAVGQDFALELVETLWRGIAPDTS